MVEQTGLEPARIASLASETRASTNSAIAPHIKIISFFKEIINKKLIDDIMNLWTKSMN